MINKTVNIQSALVFEDKNVGYLNCQVGCDMNSFNLSIQIIDKELCDKYKVEIQKISSEFIRTSLEEAVKVGWEMLDLNPPKATRAKKSN